MCGNDAGKAAEDIIGFVLLLFENRNIQGLQYFPQHGDLNDKVIGHRFAVGFVLFENQVPERRPFCIKDNTQVIGVKQIHHLAQSSDKSINSVCRESF